MYAETTWENTQWWLISFTVNCLSLKAYSKKQFVFSKHFQTFAFLDQKVQAGTMMAYYLSTVEKTTKFGNHAWIN